MTWSTIPMGRAVELNPRDRELRGRDDELEVSFVPMSAVSEQTASITELQTRRLGEVRRGYTAFQERDVLFAKITPCMENGKAALAEGLKNGLGFGSTEFHVLRARSGVEPRYVWYFVRQQSFRDAARARMRGAAGQQRVPEEFLEGYPFPLPAPSEQRRIVEILDQADALRKLCADTDELAEGVLPAVLLKLFGPPNQWSQHPTARPLGELVAPPVSGKTPPKQEERFWGGELPWVSPKDMKRDFIGDSEDHVSQAAVEEHGLKLVPPDSVLLVVRSMILAHSVPVALVQRPLTINQDMKALVAEHPSVTGPYLWAALKVAEEEILERVRTAAHGLRKLDTSDLLELPIVVPSPRALALVEETVAEVRSSLVRRHERRDLIENIFSHLLQRAFDGSLTRKWHDAYLTQLLQEAREQARALSLPITGSAHP